MHEERVAAVPLGSMHGAVLRVGRMHASEQASGHKNGAVTESCRVDLAWPVCQSLPAQGYTASSRLTANAPSVGSLGQGFCPALDRGLCHWSRHDRGKSQTKSEAQRRSVSRALE